MADMFQHRDTLEALNRQAPLKEKLICAHEVVQQTSPFVARIAVTLYDSETAILKTYLDSSGQDTSLEHYQVSLDDAPSLQEVLKRGHPRVVNDLVTFEDGRHEHTRRIGRHGYAASYTMPMFNAGDFIGFIFFNSHEKDVFSEYVLRELDVFGHLIALMVITELSTINVLTAAVKTTGEMTHVRDPETGSHLDRMSRYSRLIANTLAEKYHLDDDYIEHVFMFAPLHDVGKIAIPDRILLKPGKLDAEERVVMRTHASRGRQMIDELIENFGLQNVDHIDVLRNIAECHHEAVNGTGYPNGKSGDDIPLEARIVAVADIFDALTSRRPYKKAWTNDDAFAMLRELAGEKLQEDCVEALIACRTEVEVIQARFTENTVG